MASFKGSPPEVPGHILVWDVQQDGSLSAEAQQVDAPTGGSLTFSMTPIPNQNAFLVTDPGVGFTIFDFSGGNRSSAVTIDGQSATCWSTFSPKTGNFFVVDVGTATITEVHVDSNTLQASIVKVRGTLVDTSASCGTDGAAYSNIRRRPTLAQLIAMWLLSEGKSE